ncbi:hypothetical protein [Streptomyces sp. NPDC001978]|uniref:hypothetical protein n=1 Tax=Streptomyces sp. NPDC001978 TaxID=3364627 RepID=UPI003685F9E3
MPEYFSSRKFLLDPQSQEKAVAAVAQKLGWRHLGVLPEDATALAPYEVIWGKSQDLTLHYREDFLTKSPCAFVTGSDEHRVATAARFVEARLEPATVEEILEAADTVQHISADYALAVLRLGLGAPESFDERFSARIARAAEHPETEVRKAAAWATSYVIWPQFIPLLDQMAGQDSSEDVRRVARKILNAYLAEGGSHE